MSGGGVENNWRLGVGMNILFYFIYLFFLIIRFFIIFFFSSSYTGYGPQRFKGIYLPAVTSSFS